MIVWMDDALFAGGAARDLDRLALLRNAALRRHTLIVSMSPDAPWGARRSPHFDAWLAALPDRLRAEVPMLQERADRVSVNAVVRGATRVLVSATDLSTQHSGCWLSLEDAVRAVAQPLHIIVEHQIHDAAFLRRVMPPVWRKQFEAWERRGELRYENGGGLPVMKAMVEFFCHDDNARLAFGLPAELWRLVHFLVYDHDGNRAEVPGEGSGLLEGACDRAGMTNHHYRLKRRNQENYLPIKAMRQIVDTEISDPANHKQLIEKIDAYAAMGKEKHFENLENYLKAFKNAFATAAPSASSWPDNWFEEDGAWPEMTNLAERIASAM